MSGYVNVELRRAVWSRAQGCCEYCHLAEEDAGFRFHIEHIIAEKHQGETILNNLALSCPICNSHKGSDISSVDRQVTQKIHPLFNPREQQWDEHFKLDGSIITPLTPEGRVTTSLLKFNTPQRIAERVILIRLGRYPCIPPT